MSGEHNCVATKVEKNGDLNNALATSTVMEAGKHRISMKLTKHDARSLYVLVGVVRDGTPWNKFHGASINRDGWLMHSQGSLWGNGKFASDKAGWILDEQTVTMEINMNGPGTLRFWVDGKQHGPGWTSGVKGRLRWVTTVGYTGTDVKIVPTPELEEWKELGATAAKTE